MNTSILDAKSDSEELDSVPGAGFSDWMNPSIIDAVRGSRDREAVPAAGFLLGFHEKAANAILGRIPVIGNPNIIMSGKRIVAAARIRPWAGGCTGRPACGRRSRCARSSRARRRWRSG